MSIIKNKDIYDSSQGDPLKPITDALELLDTKIDKLKKSMTGLEMSIQKVNKTGSGNEAKILIENTSKLSTETDKLINIEKAKLSVQNQLKANQEKLLLVEKGYTKELEETKQKLSNLNKEQKENVILAKKEGDEYKKLSIEFNRAAKAAKDLAAKYGINSKEAKEAAASANLLNNKLKSIDVSVGQYGRHVGDYQRALSNFGASIKNFFSITAIIAGIKYIADFTKEIMKLGAELQGTQMNFEKLNRPDLLSKLRDATGGTISDIELMKASLDADDFKANLDNLPLYFAYARKEVQETGGSVTELVSSLIQGLGKESPKVLTRLGISTKDFKNELAKTHDYAKAVTNILTERMKEAGTYIETASDVTARWSARWENFKATGGAILDSVLTKISPVLEKIWDNLGKLWERATSFIIDFVNGWIDLYNESVNFRAIVESISLVFTQLWQTIKLFFGLMKDNLSTIGDLIAYTFNPKNWNKDFGKGFRDIFEKNISDNINDFKKYGQNIGNSFVDGFSNVIKGKKNKLTREDFQFSGVGSTSFSSGGEGSGGGTGSSETTKVEYDPMKDPVVQAYLEHNKAANESRAYIENEEAQLATYEKQLSDEKIAQDQAEWDAQVEFAEKQQELRDYQLEKEQEFYEKRNALIADSVSMAAEELGGLAASGELTIKEFSKTLIKLALDITEKMLLMSIAEMTAKQIATKGFAGIATAAILSGLIKGLMTGLKAAVSGFASGTDYVNGPGTSTSDSIPARLSKGERVVPANINKQLMGVSNKDLPKIINNGINTIRLEKLLNKVDENTSLSAFYLSNLEVHHEDQKYKYYKDVKTGITHRIIKG